MRPHPHLLELNARFWLHRLSQAHGRRLTLAAIPDRELRALADRGFDLVWLMGAWKRSAGSRRQALESASLRRGYDEALPGWGEEDVIGSPYAVFEYTLDPALGEPEELAVFRSRLNRLGLGLIVDFVSNHLAVDHPWTSRFPARFIKVSRDEARQQEKWFFTTEKGDCLAHGRDPNFPPWTDTAQVNFFSPDLQEALEDEMLRIVGMADGVRCDMAMLALSRIFQEVWGRFVKEPRPAEEFWMLLLHRVRARKPDFLFLGESYWNLEWELQQVGFDYTYDKVLYDRLRYSNTEDVRGHFRAEESFQKKSVRFIENHDESRAIAAFGRERSMAAAVVAGTVQGLRFFQDGQFEGRKIRVPIQLAREPIESPDPELLEFYRRLADFAGGPSLHEGEWRLIEPSPAWEGNRSDRNILAWSWTADSGVKVVAVNYSPNPAQARLKIDSFRGDNGNIGFHDRLAGATYFQPADEVHRQGLYVELGPWKTHLFDVAPAAARK